MNRSVWARIVLLAWDAVARAQARSAAAHITREERREVERTYALALAAAPKGAGDFPPIIFRD